MAGKGGGAWKVAYADFVTAMMAFFLVMWITAQSKQVKIAVAHYFNDPFNSASKTEGPQPAGSTTTGPDPPGSDGGTNASNKPGSPLGVAPFKTVPRPRKKTGGDLGTKRMPGAGPKEGDGEKPILSVLHDGDDRTRGMVILFAESSGALDDRGKEQLKKLVPVLLGKRQKIELRGHARRRPSSSDGSVLDPWQLSYARCVATMKYLEQAGIEPERIRLSQAGAYEPHTIRADPASQALNSCVDLYVLNEFVEDLVGSREERAQRFKTP